MAPTDRHRSVYQRCRAGDFGCGAISSRLHQRGPWLLFGHLHLSGQFPYLPQQPGYNKRLCKLVGTLSWLIRALGTRTNMFDDVWIADSTPVECGRSRETAKRSDLASFAEYGNCASHSRSFWGLLLYMLCTLHG